MPAGTPNYTPKTSLTLSAAPDLLREDGQAASAIERELEAIARGGAADRLIDMVWRGASTLEGDGWTARDADVITESELRGLDGNR